MKLLVFVSLLFFSLLDLPAFAQVQQVVVPYTQADRDRAILIGAKLDALNGKFESIDGRFVSINKQFNDLHRQFNDLKTILYWGFGILITLFIFMLVYMIWDHYTRYATSFNTSIEGRRK